MEKDIAAGKLGNVGEYDLEFKNGMLSLSVKADAGPLKAGLSIELGADAVIDALKVAIPGTLDDALLELLKSALKA